MLASPSKDPQKQRLKPNAFYIEELITSYMSGKSILKLAQEFNIEPANIHSYESWIDEETGLYCKARRHLLGVWLGYVRVPERHPWYGQDLQNIDFPIHGGLTFEGYLENLEGFWIGFDCAHPGDIIPGINGRFLNVSGDTYKNLDFIKAECKKLAQAVYALQGGYQYKEVPESNG